MPANDPGRQTWRFWVIASAFILLTAIVVVQLVRYQVLRRDEATPLGVAPAPVAPRAPILDRNGEVLAGDRFLYVLSTTPNKIETDRERLTIAQALESLIGVSAQESWRTLTNPANENYVVLASGVSEFDARRVQDYVAQQVEEDGVSPLQQIHIAPEPVRYRPNRDLASQVLGIVVVGHDGYYGVEGYYDPFLHMDGPGLIGKSSAGIDSLPRSVRQQLPTPADKALVLTIDRAVQWIIEEELRNGLQEHEAVAGTIIVMDPDTGALLGLANLPSFDPERYTETPVDLFANPAISLQYEPGSIFKIVTMAAALDSGLLTPSTVYTDTGYISVGGRAIYNSNRVGHGLVTATEALARSLNVVTAQIAVEMGAGTFYQYLQRFGFGQATNVDLSGEINGQIKAPGSQDWSPADLGTNSFGQGVAVTPIQMVRAAAAIANGGHLMQPHVVQAKIVGDRVQYTQPTVAQIVMRPETAAALTEMMVEVVDTGNTKASVPGYRVAGKSGTAQIATVGGYEREETIVSFVGFAPADDPQFVVLVKLDRPNPNLNQWGSNTAAPVFANVTRRILNYMNVPPDDIRMGGVAQGRE